MMCSEMAMAGGSLHTHPGGSRTMYVLLRLLQLIGLGHIIITVHQSKSVPAALHSDICTLQALCTPQAVATTAVCLGHNSQILIIPLFLLNGIREVCVTKPYTT